MEALYALVNHVAGRCARRMRPPEAIEDLASEAFRRALENAAAALRRSSPRTMLSAWLAGAIRNLALEGGRTPYIPLDPTVLAGVDRGRRVAPAGRRPAGLSGGHDAELTTKQLRAVRLWRKGLAVRRIARQEGVTPKAVRERLARAFRKGAPESRGTGEQKAAQEERRRSALDLLRRSRNPKPLNARILRLLATGLTHAEIAEHCGLSRDAVRMRLRRLRCPSSRGRCAGKPSDPAAGASFRKPCVPPSPPPPVTYR